MLISTIRIDIGPYVHRIPDKLVTSPRPPNIGYKIGINYKKTNYLFDLFDSTFCGSNFLKQMAMIQKCNATGKTIFPTKQDAKATIKKIKGFFRYLRERHKARHRWGKPSQKRTYYCSHCKGYHLTSWNFCSVKTEKENKAKHRFIVEHILSLVR